jgi:hypothetical protein
LRAAFVVTKQLIYDKTNEVTESNLKIEELKKELGFMKSSYARLQQVTGY